MVYKYLHHDRFMHALYNNMPIVWIMDGNDNTRQLDFTSTHSLLIMALSYALDLLARPLLTYYSWRKHSKGGDG
jgi:hypothetical protein